MIQKERARQKKIAEKRLSKNLNMMNDNIKNKGEVGILEKFKALGSKNTYTQH
jgi:hypothetical protein